MDALPSPYTPGVTATFLPGRDTHVTRMRHELQGLAESGALVGRVKVFVGGRGIGKTSLLRHGQRLAREQGLHAIWITAGDAPLLPSLCAELEAMTRTWADTAREELLALVRRTELTVKLPFADVKTSLPGPTTASARPAPGTSVEELLTTAARSARAQGSAGLAIFIDELQSADTDGLRALAYAWQQLQSAQAAVPAALICAGLGHTSDVVTDAASFAERFDYQRLRDLSLEAAHTAVLEPADRLGVVWRTDALDTLMDKAAGYPHFIQLCAHAAWQTAAPVRGGAITIGHVAASEEEVDDQLEIFYRTRWAKATSAERELLRAVAAQPSSTPRRKDVADALGRTTQAISMARRSLMDKGILDSPGRGLLAFTAPGFADYILSEDGTDD